MRVVTGVQVSLVGSEDPITNEKFTQRTSEFVKALTGVAMGLYVRRKQGTIW
jgi:hypothetical protein